MRNQKGFTLIELLVVIAIIGILSTIVLVSVNDARIKARDARRVSELRSIATALEVYYDKYGEYPPGPGIKDPEGDGYARAGSNVETNWESMLGCLVVEGFLAKLPVDSVNTWDDDDCDSGTCGCMQIYIYRAEYSHGSYGSYELATVQESDFGENCKSECGLWQEGEPGESTYQFCITSN